MLLLIFLLNVWSVRCARGRREILPVCALQPTLLVLIMGGVREDWAPSGLVWREDSQGRSKLSPPLPPPSHLPPSSRQQSLLSRVSLGSLSPNTCPPGQFQGPPASVLTPTCHPSPPSTSAFRILFPSWTTSPAGSWTSCPTPSIPSQVPPSADPFTPSPAPHPSRLATTPSLPCPL